MLLFSDRKLPLLGALDTTLEALLIYNGFPSG